jgi:hypothetical protein
LLQDLRLCHRAGEIYSGDGNVFTKKFAECLACFLKGFSILLSENETKQKVKQVAIAASEVEDVLKWLIPVMQAVGYCTRDRKNRVENVIRQFESQRTC